MTFSNLLIDFIIALLIGSAIGWLVLLLRAPLPNSRRLRALRRRLLGRAWRPVLLIPVVPARPDIPHASEEDRPSVSSR